MPISLPKDPTGAQYEDLVAAALVSAGHFVEAQLKLRDDGKEVLELDVVSTPVGGNAGDRRLWEVKRPAFSFTNIFKLHGQAMFLGIRASALVSAEGCEPRYRPVYEGRGAAMGVEVVHLPPDLAELGRLGDPPNGLDGARLRSVAAPSWYGSIGRRVALGSLRSACKANRGVPEYEAPRLYEFNSRASFFLTSPVERAEALYHAYFENPKMAGALVTYQAGRQGVAEEQIWTSARDTHRELEIQCVMDLESKARFSIIKNALDDYIERGTVAPPTTTMHFGGLTLDVPDHGLPASFLTGLEALATHKHSSRLPYLFQAFYLLFGGFLSLESDDDRDLLSEISGISADEIIDALMMIDQFGFGREASFFFCPKDKLLCLKMVPGVVRGAGAFLRQAVLGIDDYSDLYPDMGWLISRWHNALYHALEPELG